MGESRLIARAWRPVRFAWRCEMKLCDGEELKFIQDARTLDTAMSIRVALVEDDSAYREALAVILRGTPGFALVGTYPNAEMALANFVSPAPDVCLVDVRLPVISGIEFVRTLRDRHPTSLAVMLTAFEDLELLFPALMAGAHGYILKTTPPAQILAHIHEVIGGGAPMSRSIARRIIQHFHPSARGYSTAQSLSERERMVLDHLATGRLIKEIADALQVDLETVRTHLRKIYRKLHVHSRHEAVVKYLDGR